MKSAKCRVEEHIWLRIYSFIGIDKEYKLKKPAWLCLKCEYKVNKIPKMTENMKATDNNDKL